LRGLRDTADKISAAEYKTELHAELRGFGDIIGDLVDGLRLNAGVHSSGKSFTAEFKQNATVFGRA
jgi:hypothetical protein